MRNQEEINAQLDMKENLFHGKKERREFRMVARRYNGVSGA